MIPRSDYFFLALVCAASSGFGQTAPALPQPAAPAGASQAAEEMPSDPAALLALAAKKNGLQNAGAAPWHSKATYEVLNDDGSVKEMGTYEEFYASEESYRRSYTSPSFTQTDYSTEKGLFRSGATQWPEKAVERVRGSFFPQFPADKAIEKGKFVLKHETIGDAALICIISNSPTEFPTPPVELHYLDKDAPIERVDVTLSGGYETAYNQIIVFRGAYVAQDVRITRMKKPLVHVHLDLLESTSSIDEKFLTAPPDAVAIIRRVPQVHKLEWLTRPQADFPREAVREGAFGRVTMELVIGKDGRVIDAQPVSGPEVFFESAVRSAKNMSFKPGSLNGVPVEFEANAAVEFAFHGVPR